MSGENGNESDIYRVAIVDSSAVKVEQVGVSVGFDYVEKVDTGWYDNTTQLPEWMQHKLAVLMVCDARPPTPDIPGVGRRISSDIFWVFADKRR